jgi:hypothetical protein
MALKKIGKIPDVLQKLLQSKGKPIAAITAGLAPIGKLDETPGGRAQALAVPESYLFKVVKGDGFEWGDPEKKVKNSSVHMMMANTVFAQAIDRDGDGIVDTVDYMMRKVKAAMDSDGDGVIDALDVIEIDPDYNDPFKGWES